LKVFIVDDDAAMVMIMTQPLVRAGHEVRSTTASGEAVEDIRAFQPDCVILDLMMPDVDGGELCARLKADPDLPGLKVIIVSAKAFDSDRERAYSSGADGFLVNSIKSCNSFAAGELMMMREIETRTGKPAAFIETDLVDPRYFSPANVKNRLESYFQMIDQKRQGGSPSQAA